MAHTASERLATAVTRAEAELLARRNARGHWDGSLSSSALSTATAVTALAVAGQTRSSQAHQARIAAGLDWLARHPNADGGWGDTTLSLSNLSTTTLCRSALQMSGPDRFTTTVANASNWLAQEVGDNDPRHLAKAIIRRYGKDRTFSVPILTHCALAGSLGPGKEAWQDVIALPFELAALPHQFFAALRLPVVSYALPALIAIGQARHFHSPCRNPILRLARNLSKQRTLRVLTEIQPHNGGFLEATPLTSFVVMSLAGSGQQDHAVTSRGITFLLESQRPDGSWPIDTNLATWVTTLAINALHPGGTTRNTPQPSERSTTAGWLLDQQCREEHPYTHAAPGGWAWTDLPGGVPDADDTSGALIALNRLAPDEPATLKAVVGGIDWLIGLQNRDGGIPTFCRGWGALPFDRSSADITAHTLRAWATWFPRLEAAHQSRISKAIGKAVNYLARVQHSNGSWLPLWFGNQHVTDDHNPTYGTSKVLHALADLSGLQEILKLDSPTGAAIGHSALAAAGWLMGSQNQDGSWGGGPGVRGSIEETALALEALSHLAKNQGASSSRERAVDAIRRGTGWLVERVEEGSWKQPAPIGFYFAKLWYYETLYPLIFTVAALKAARPVLADQIPTPGSRPIQP